MKLYSFFFNSVILYLANQIEQPASLNRQFTKRINYQRFVYLYKYLHILLYMLILKDPEFFFASENKSNIIMESLTRLFKLS